MKNFTKILNQKETYNLIHENFIYTKENRTNKAWGWRCADRKCSSVGIVSENEVFIVVKPHNHQADRIKVEKKIALSKMKEKATTSCENITDVITSVTASLENEIVVSLPKYRSMFDNSTRQRNIKSNFNTTFDDIPEHFKRDLQRKKFLQYDSGPNDVDRFIVLFSENNSNILSSISTVLIDGTFWCVPREFSQLITIHCLLFGKYFPLCYILMNSKQQEAYNVVFSKIKELINCRFRHIIVDFEIGLKNSLINAFPNALLFGCSFHFGQSNWRHIQSLGLARDYEKNIEINKLIRMFLNLVFVPEVAIKKEFEKLVEITKEKKNEKIYSFIEYFKKNYIGEKGKKPLFSEKFWSCNYRVLNNIPRSINCLEAWHRELNFKCKISHLNLGKFLNILITECERIRVCILQSKKILN